MTPVQLAGHLAARSADITALRIFAGLDAFVDEDVRVVGTRSTPDAWTALPTLTDFGRVVGDAAGRNSLREIVLQGRHPGGCAINLGAQLAALGAAVDLAATTGGDPVFDGLGVASLTPLGVMPGRTLAFEFDDGKLMLCAASHLAGLTAQHLAGHLDALRPRVASAQALALTNWSLFPGMTGCWRLLVDHLLTGQSRRPLLIDLVDPSGRTAADLAGLHDVLGHLQARMDVHLSLNLPEAGVLARHRGLPAPTAPTATAAAALREAWGVGHLILHNRAGNAVARPTGTTERLPGPHCTSPVRSTGAGDRFNAGYLLGIALGLDDAARLDLGSAVSGAFLRKGTSPDLDAVVALLGDPTWPR